MNHRLLHPPEGQEAVFRDEVYTVIDRYHSHLEAEQVLDEFPEDTSFQVLYPFTAQAITASTENMYNTRMKFNLTMSDYAQVSVPSD